jgi:peptidoglycan/xylan/chitin deacetylase (PgdA/CDA1 family)
MNPTPGTIALTFDDGPDPTWTAEVLAELRRGDARATFFVEARRALARPDLVEAMLEAGHEVGFHCVEHIRHSERSEAAIAADAAMGLAMLDSIGVRPLAWRTPWGVVGETTRRVAAEHGLELWGWNLDSHDWRGDTCAEMLAAVETEGGLRDGSVVLMHDGIGPGARRSGCAQTVWLTRALLGAATTAGLRAAAVSDSKVLP